MKLYTYTQTAPQQLTSSCRKPVGDLCNTSPGCCACSRFHFCGLTSAKQLGDLPVTKNSQYAKYPRSCARTALFSVGTGSYAINAKFPGKVTAEEPRKRHRAMPTSAHASFRASNAEVHRGHQEKLIKCIKMH